jgi:hypothetical protein
MTSGPSPQNAAADGGYPVQFRVVYPDRPLKPSDHGLPAVRRDTDLIVLWSIGGASADWTGETRYLTVGGTLGGTLFLPPLLMILFRRKSPGSGSTSTSSCSGSPTAWARTWR